MEVNWILKAGKTWANHTGHSAIQQLLIHCLPSASVEHNNEAKKYAIKMHTREWDSKNKLFEKEKVLMNQKSSFGHCWTNVVIEKHSVY
jgi:hypothetical protein